MNRLGTRSVDILKVAGGIILILIIISVAAFSLGWIGEQFRASPILFLAFHISIPIFTYLIRHHKIAIEKHLTPSGIKKLGGFLSAISSFLAILVFAHYEFFRDIIGYNLLPGYEVILEDWTPPVPLSATADGFVSKAVLYSLQWIFIIQLFALPLMTILIFDNSKNEIIKRRSLHLYEVKGVPRKERSQDDCSDG